MNLKEKSMTNLYMYFFLGLRLGTLSNDDGDAKDEAKKKMNLYFTVEFRICLDLFNASMGFRTCQA